MSDGVLLISIPPAGIDIAYHDAAAHHPPLQPPLGLFYLYCALKREYPEIQVSHLDLNICSGLCSTFTNYDDYTKFMEDALKQYMEKPPQIIGISVNFTTSHVFFMLLAETARNILPDCTIIAGGCHITAVGEYILENTDLADYIICGEGEAVFPELCRRILAGGRGIGDLSGVHWKGRIRKNAAGKLQAAALPENIDLDFRLYPEFMDMEFYASHSNFNSTLSVAPEKANSFSVMASRGCPVGCSFCASALMHGRRPRWRSLENISDEIIWLHNTWRINCIIILDDNFVPETKALDLFAMLRDLNIPELHMIVLNMSVNHTTKAIIDALSEAGIVDLSLAVESASPEMQKKIGKNLDMKKLEYLVQYAKSKDMLIKLFFMIGFPGESAESMRQTVALAKRLDVDWITCSIATPFPGTKMYDEFVNLGYIKDSPEYWQANNSWMERLFDTEEISAKDISEMSFLAVLELNYGHVRLLREGKLDVAEAVYLNRVKSIKNQLFGFDMLRRIYAERGDAIRQKMTIEHMKHLIRTDETARSYLKYADLLDDDIRNVLLIESLQAEGEEKPNGDVFAGK
ncbi:MAG: B12-binding domain-containing radical SAM protein [Candidatus Adiutrix sp.]|nr:B12-binding domain-containing radical SAM protein [Candidatus Adiutrix sp.]